MTVKANPNSLLESLVFSTEGEQLFARNIEMWDGTAAVMGVPVSHYAVAEYQQTFMDVLSALRTPGRTIDESILALYLSGWKPPFTSTLLTAWHAIILILQQQLAQVNPNVGPGAAPAGTTLPPYYAPGDENAAGASLQNALEQNSGAVQTAAQKTGLSPAVIAGVILALLAFS